jgi:hypothetical protein
MHITTARWLTITKSEAIILDPSDPTAYYYRGVIYCEQGKMPRRKPILKRGSYSATNCLASALLERQGSQPIP